MTNEESAKILLDYRDAYCDEGSRNYKALTNAVEALRNTCEDAISRQAALDTCLNIYFNGYKEKDVLHDIKNLPPVNPQSKTGHWVVLSATDMYCSECNEIEHLDTNRRFCAYCGAKMVEPQEQESEEQRMTIEEINKIASDYLNHCESRLDVLEVFALAKELLETEKADKPEEEVNK